MRTLFIDILGLGAVGLRARRRANLQIADFILSVVNDPASKSRRARPLSNEMAMAIVGGVNELVLQAIEEHRADRLTELSGAAAELARAVIDGTNRG